MAIKLSWPAPVRFCLRCRSVMSVPVQVGDVSECSCPWFMIPDVVFVVDGGRAYRWLEITIEGTIAYHEEVKL